MKKILHLLFLLSIPLIAQQPFDCSDGSFYQVISGALKAYDPITGSYSEALHTYSAYNAGGYNAVDDYLYAIKSGDNHLLRIGKDAITDLGVVTGSSSIPFGGGYAADVDAEGNLWVFQNTDKRHFHKITFLQDYDGENNPVFEVIETDKTAPSPCADVVFLQGSLYGGSRGQLFQWDLSSEIPIFSSKAVANLPNSTFGAAYADVQGRLYFSDNQGGLYLINDYESDSPWATLLNLTETTNSNDGFKCANGISPLDRDQDGILDISDADSDGDGIPNLLECNGNPPYGDSDGDGMYNYLDNDTSGNGNNVVQDAFDRDKDGNPDFLDLDSDNDGIYDIVEAGIGVWDTNNDGIYNPLDQGFTDLDGDGIAAVFDTDQQGTPVSPLDFDQDGIFDCYDIDSDNDGIIDLIEGQNGKSYLGISGNDADRDGLDDHFDPDFGGTTNGTTNTDATDGFDHLDTDLDNDGITDTVMAYDWDKDGIAETIASGLDQDQDGLDDSFDQRKSSFNASNGGQSPLSFPMPAICNRYNYLGEFTNTGKPLYLDGQDIVSTETLEQIHNALPEGYPVPEYNPHYISSGYETDLTLKESANIWVTFVGEGAGYRNTLGFYTYDSSNPSPTPPQPEDITIIFPNVSEVGSGGDLEIGDKVNIGNFDAGTSIGWVLLADAWKDGCIDTGNWTLFSDPRFNPESNENLRYHNVLLNESDQERIILGFEDIRRDRSSCDQDFNDALFYITASPITAIDTDNIAAVDSGTAVSSANEGGLESNGDLASLIAQRNFSRAKEQTSVYAKNSQMKFSPKAISYQSKSAEDLSRYFPLTSLSGNDEVYVSSPKDLIGITNAKTVFSVDYYQKSNRIAAALAIATTGKVYDHTKTICDRLNGSKLLDIRPVSVKNQHIISAKIQRASGQIEYTLTFSIRKEAHQNELYSLWNIDNYPDGNYHNFQIWGGSVREVAHIANTVIDTYQSQKPLVSPAKKNNLPAVFVQKGKYSKGKLELDLVNTSGAKWMVFDANLRQTETTASKSKQQIISLSGAYYEKISIKTGYLFDIGFTIIGQNATTTDALYLADGPWGIDHTDSGAEVNQLEITAQETAIETKGFGVERGIKINGKIKETINVFRNILPGALTLNTKGFTSLQFNLQSTKDIEVILVTKDLIAWENRLRVKINASKIKKQHTLSLADFTKFAKSKSAAMEIKSVVFSIQGDYQKYEYFAMALDGLHFIESNALHLENDITKNNAKLVAYPNPCQDRMYIQLPETVPANSVSIRVFDLLGRIVQQKHLESNTSKKVEFMTDTLLPGQYHYQLTTLDKQSYTGSFVVQK